MDVKEIQAIRNDAKKYQCRLQSLYKQLKNAETQITNSSQTAIDEIETTFANLSKELNELLGKRKEELQETAKKIKDQNLEPIKSSQLLIEEKLNETHKLIEIAENGSGNIDENDFLCKSSLIGSLPEVPELKEVTFITFQYNKQQENDLYSGLKQFGAINRIAPVQISSLISKPGAILVEWEILDSEEPFSEIQEYQLQKAIGNYNIETNLTFHDCYKGQELQYLVQDLTPLQDYSFRIRCRFDYEHSPWSMIQIGKTSIQPYTWRSTNEFLLSNERRIATSCMSGCIYSDGKQFKIGNTLDFSIIEIPLNMNPINNFIGLSVNDNVADLLDEGTFVLEATGKVFIDGTLKATQFMPLGKGVKVSFMCSHINEDKLRINIDVSDKRVTYDWNIAYKNGLYFIAKFNSSKWKLLVE